MITKWLIKQFMRFQIFVYRRSGGRRLGHMRGMPLLLLTTTGRKTGAQRVTPVMHIRDGDDYVIAASNNGAPQLPAWFLNLQANPQVTVEVDGTTQTMTARQATPGETTRLWAELVEKAPFFENYRQKTTRNIPMVILQPAAR